MSFKNFLIEMGRIANDFNNAICITETSDLIYYYTIFKQTEDQLQYHWQTNIDEKIYFDQLNENIKTLSLKPYLYFAIAWRFGNALNKGLRFNPDLVVWADSQKDTIAKATITPGPATKKIPGLTLPIINLRDVPFGMRELKERFIDFNENAGISIDIMSLNLRTGSVDASGKPRGGRWLKIIEAYLNKTNPGRIYFPLSKKT